MDELRNYLKSDIENKINDSINDSKVPSEIGDLERTQVAAVFQHAADKVSHYSEQTRKEAISLLAKTFTKSPWILKTRASDVFTWFGRLMCDESNEVRKITLSVFKDILSGLEAEHVSPFSPLLIAFLSAAMTHIRPEIQIDGVRFLIAVQKTFPQILVSNSPRLIKNYLTILGIRSVEGLSKLAEDLDDDPFESGTMTEASDENDHSTIMALDKAASWRNDLVLYSREALNSIIKTDDDESDIKRPINSFIKDTQKNKKVKKMAGLKMRVKREVFRGIAELIEISHKAETLCYFPWRKPYNEKVGACILKWPTESHDTVDEVNLQPRYLELPSRFLLYGEQGNQPRFSVFGN